MTLRNLLHRWLTARNLLLVGMVAFAAASRAIPHPWNFTAVGAMALFGGATFSSKRAAVFIPLAALFAGDLSSGLYNYKLMVVVYASFLLSVCIGFWLRHQRTVPRIAAAILASAAQFFAVTNFAVWAFGMTYPKTAAGLAACYVAGIPFFWNTLAGDAIYATLLFGALALAERKFPALRETSVAARG
jgi:uncharacterized protein DUF6580